MAEIPTADWFRINDAADRFERAWKQGPRPRIEDYLAEAEPGLRAVLLEELLRVERELRRRAGEVPSRREYAPRFPEQAELIDAVFGPVPARSAASRPHPASKITPAVPPGENLEGDAGMAAAGTRVRYFGDYELMREAGRGGMGVVYLARQMSLNRTVALKMILAGQLANATDVRRFHIEAEAAANLDHPGVVPIYEVGEHEGQCYFSMGFVEGPSLAQRLADGPLLPRQAAALLVRVAEAIEYAHRHGVIHRDIKPGNILLDALGNPRITDFGLAKRVQSESGLTGSDQIIGTPSYMPPEQAMVLGVGVDVTADVYALGATLYASVTGRPPFQAATAMETVLQVIDEEPVPPRRLNAALPKDLETIILKCLAKDPGKRYASAMALGDDLRRYLAGDPIVARPVTAVERVGKWIRRRPAIASLAMTVILAMTFGMAGISWQWRRAEKNYAVAEAQRQVAQEKTLELEEKAELLERQNYINLVALAQRENLANNVGYAEQLLDRCPPRLRGWEWRFVNWSNHRELFSVGVPPRPRMARAVLSPGEDRVAGCGGNDAWIYDLASGRQLHHLRGHQGAVQAIAWSPDGATVATGGEDKSIRLWNPTTGDEVAALRGHEAWIFGLAFSPDSHRLITGGGGYPHTPGLRPEVKLWDLRERREVRAYYGVGGWRVTSVAFSPDGRMIAAGDSLGAHLWDVDTARLLRDFKGLHKYSTFYEDAQVENVAFSPDGRMLATCEPDGLAALWDVDTGKILQVLRGHAGVTIGLAFSADGRRLATGSIDATIRLWDPETGRETGLLRGHQYKISSLQFDRTGARLLSSGPGNVAKVWDISLAPDPLVLEGHHGWAFSAAFRPGRRTVATGGWRLIHSWDLDTGRRLGSIDDPHPAGVLSVAYSPDGRSLATTGESRGDGAEGGARIWDAESLALRHELKGHTGTVFGVAYSPDGTTLATAGMDGTVRFWDPATGTPRRVLRAHIKGVASLAFSPDGNRLATVGFSDTAKLWAVASGDELVTFDVTISDFSPGIVETVALSPDGRLLAVPRADGRLALFDAETGRLIRDIAGHSDGVYTVAFSPDGRRLATAGDRIIRLWDPDTGEELFNLRGHLGGVTSITWSVDGRRIVTTGMDRTARIWDAGPPAIEVIRDR